MQNLLLSNTNQTAIGVTTRPGPSLDLNFAASLNCIDQVSGRDLITFNRTTSGTYVDSTGVLRSAAVNLLLRSEEFDNLSIWGALNATVSANTQTAPNGTTSAETITDVNGVTSANVGCFQSTTLADSTNYAMSCYVKAGTKTTCRVGIRDKTGANIFANFNLATASTTVGNALSSTIQDAGNGWYRCTAICASLTGATSPRGLVYMDTSGYTADGTGTIHVWGAQLETGSVATPYIPTTSAINSAPRFDHDPTTLESLGLLVEEARTNLLLRSEDFSTTWTRTIITAFGSGSEVDVETAPNGTLTADLIATASGNNSGTGFVGQTITKLATATTYTITVFAKAQNWDTLRLQVNDSATNNNRATVTFSLATGLITTAAATFGTFSAASAVPASSFVNGWFRANLTFTSSTETGLLVRIFPDNSSTVTADGTSGIYVWGAQLEAGAFPTSYIPTVAATVTRAADVASITGTNFSSWYRQSEGTVFGEGITFSTTQTAALLSIDDTTSNNRIQIRRGAAGPLSNLRMVSSGGSIDANFTSGTALGTNKIAVAAIASNQSAASNGSLFTGITSISPMPTVTQLVIGAGVASTVWNGTIRRITYYPIRISNPLLQAITI